MRLLTILSLAIVIATSPTYLLAQKVALVIGNSNYQKASDLANPENDAQRISESLEKQGFIVELALNLSRTEMYDSLRKFRSKADSASFAMVYYAGHGIEVAGVNYLVPIDAELLDERDASVELVTVETILNQISGASQMKMVVLDACRNNPFVAEMKRNNAGRSVSRGLGKIETSEADTLIAYAAAAGAVTPDGESGGNSPFTAAFLKALDGTPKDVRRLLGTVRDEMRQSVPGAAPFVYTSLGGGEYIINPHSPGGDPAAASNLAQPTSQSNSTNLAMLADFQLAIQKSTLREWDGFLLRYRVQQSSSVYALAVQNRALLIKSDPNAPVVVNRSAPPFEAPENKRDAVRMLQNYLKDRRCFRSSVDGFYGPRTARGLARYTTKSGTEFKLPGRPELDELLPVLRAITPDTQTECAIQRAATPAYKPRKPQNPAGNAPLSALRQTPPKSTRSTTKSNQPSAAPATPCLVFEGQSTCN